MTSHDYSINLSDLISKKQELEDELEQVQEAIDAFEKLEVLGFFKNAPDTHYSNGSNVQVSNISKLGVYEGTAVLLEKKNESMKTKDIIQGLVANGVIKKNTPFNNVATTLYKAVKDKKDCKISKVGKGEWGLASWNN